MVMVVLALLLDGGAKWEEEMKFLQEIRGPVVFTRASEDAKDSGARAGEAPDEVVKGRFLGQL